MPNWKDVLEEHQEIQRTSQFAIDIIRRKYLKQLYEYTNRNVIAYYSGFLSKPGILQSDINDEDKNGFMMAVHKLDRNRGLDLILHTPGGSIAATESVVDYLHKMFGGNIRAIVPQIAMSAGTMMACSCKAIILSKHSNLGPIDPHLGGMPAYGVIEEFRRACREVKSDSSRIPIWQSIISQYSPTFLKPV
jgi:ClpP class serine protease